MHTHTEEIEVGKFTRGWAHEDTDRRAFYTSSRPHIYLFNR
jgi:hypothetical protein